MADDKRSCKVCNKDEEQRILIHAIIDGKDEYVCVKCLPALIHG